MNRLKQAARTRASRARPERFRVATTSRTCARHGVPPSARRRPQDDATHADRGDGATPKQAANSLITAHASRNRLRRKSK